MKSMTTFTKCNYCKRGNKHVSLNCTRAKSTLYCPIMTFYYIERRKVKYLFCNQGNSYKIILTRYPTFSHGKSFSNHAHKSASSYEQNQVEFHHAASSVAFSLQVVVRARSVLHRGASGHTPLNGFPILYCTKWHPKLLRFLGYKATGFFNS